MKLLQVFKEIKGVFKPPKRSYYLGRISCGTPYFYPWNFNKTILTIRKGDKPQFLRCKHFKLFGYSISYGWPIYITWYGLGWKDKYDTPRFEWQPSFQIYFFLWQFCIHWNSPVGDNDEYYEHILWYLYYADKDINKARDTWGWKYADTLISTWNNNYLI